jgi:hypothetical protein
MPNNNSSTGGYLTALPLPAVLENPSLADLIQAMLVGVTGLNPGLVRPRWQPTPPNQPPVNVSWLAFGFTERIPEAGTPWIFHDGAAAGGLGQDRLSKSQDLRLVVSCYGPAAEDYGDQVHDAFYIPQNLELLGANGIKMVDTDPMMTVPELVNAGWIYRIDLPIRLRRQTVRAYAVENIVSAQISITAKPVGLPPSLPADAGTVNEFVVTGP